MPEPRAGIANSELDAYLALSVLSGNFVSINFKHDEIERKMVLIEKYALSYDYFCYLLINYVFSFKSMNGRYSDLEFKEDISNKIDTTSYNHSTSSIMGMLTSIKNDRVDISVTKEEMSLLASDRVVCLL